MCTEKIREINIFVTRLFILTHATERLVLICIFVIIFVERRILATNCSHLDGFVKLDLTDVGR